MMEDSALRRNLAAGRFRRVKSYEIDGSAGKVTVRLREPSAELALRIHEEATALKDDDVNGMVLHQAKMIAACLLEDHGDGLAFKESEAPLLVEALGMQCIRDLFQKCQEVAGFSQDEERGNSPADQPG